MSMFTEAEIEYLNSQRIGRVATVGTSGELHVVPLRYKYNADADAIDLVGTDIDTSKKWRDAKATGRIAFVVDDMGEKRPRGIEIRGTAEIHETGGEELGVKNIGPAFIRIKASHVATWGVESDDYHAISRKIG